MSKQRNANIGMCTCAECGEIAAVRKNKAGKIYYDCLECGRITPNHSGGQGRVIDRATIWGEQGTPPDNCPTWIAEQWPYTRALSDPSGRAPLGGPSTERPVNRESPEAPPKETPKRSPRRTPPPPPPPPEKPEASPDAIPEEPSEPRGFDFME